MKIAIIYVTLSLFSLISDIYATNDYQLALELSQKTDLNAQNSIKSDLQAAKMLLINGKPNIAYQILLGINTKNSKYMGIKKRYIAIIHFILGDYRKSNNEIESMRISEKNMAFKDICMTKIFNLMALEKYSNLKYQLQNCKYITNKYTKNYQFWPTNIVALKRTSNSFNSKNELPLKRSLTKEMLHYITSIDMIQLWLKLAIYANMEHHIKPLLKYISAKAYKSKVVRELIGLLHYRLGDFENAKKFISDINTANSENILGNILLKNKQYELAYGHFNLALRHKHNSLNALERNIPLAWLLEQWDQGLEYINLLDHNGIKRKNIMTLNTAFKIQTGDFKKAWSQLLIIREEMKKTLPVELLLMGEYLALILNNPDELSYFSDNSCKKFNGMSCWLKHQAIHWKSITSQINKKSDNEKNNSISLDSLKEAPIISPFKENQVINQKDIDELDSIEFGIGPK